jgi:hypothetical protein
MTVAAKIIEAARAANVVIAVEGTDLCLESYGPPPDSLLAALRLHKTEVLGLLTVPLDAEGLPFGPCRTCGGCSFWSESYQEGPWYCARCYPTPFDRFTDGCSIPDPHHRLRLIDRLRPRPAPG